MDDHVDSLAPCGVTAGWRQPASPAGYARLHSVGRGVGAPRPWQAYDRGMTEKTPENTEPLSPSALQPVPGALELLDGEAVGYCSDGVCHFPAPKTR